MTLNLQAVDSALADLRGTYEGDRLPFALHSFDCLASTSTELWQWVARGAPPGTAIAAGRQTAGRGQRGRSWSSAAGGLYLSVFLTPDHSISEAGQILLWSAWGILATLRDAGVPARLKWPNDLVLDGRKLGGILVETRSRGDRPAGCVVGVGINWRNPTPEVGINLDGFDRLDSLERLAAIVLHGIERGGDRYARCGPEAIARHCEAWLEGIGEAIAVRGWGGAIAGLDKNGHLRINFPDSRPPLPEIAVPPGEIRLGYPRATGAKIS